MPRVKTGDYLEVSYEGQRDGDGSASTVRVGEMLDVTPPVAATVLERLEERKLVERRVAEVRGGSGVDLYSEVADA